MTKTFLYFHRRIFNTFTLLDFVGVLKTLKDAENALVFGYVWIVSGIFTI